MITKKQLLKMVDHLKEDDLITMPLANTLSLNMTEATTTPTDVLKKDFKTLRWESQSHKSIGQTAIDAMSESAADFGKEVQLDFSEFIKLCEQHNFDENPICSISGKLLNIKLPVKVYAQAFRHRFGIGIHYTLSAGGIYGELYGDFSLSLGKEEYERLKIFSLKQSR